MGWFRRWRRARVLERASLDQAAWCRAVRRYRFTRALPPADVDRLKALVTLFLHEKTMHGAGGLEVRDEMRIAIAIQACILILNLDLDYYDGWVEIIVYPGEFLARYEYVDENGVAHAVEEPMTGESWERGPVILSWADAGDGGGPGYNVVIHEFAHKIDMLNGGADGYPPLHPGMSREDWSRAFSSAFGDFRARLERGEHTLLDPYAAEDPAEFFAVASEAFFEAPQELHASYPEVYAQLGLFYRQDPLRLAVQAGA
jgi:Mlc titration factor MtfA (ptsG expression regulator)